MEGKEPFQVIFLRPTTREKRNYSLLPSFPPFPPPLSSPLSPSVNYQPSPLPPLSSGEEFADFEHNDVDLLLFRNRHTGCTVCETRNSTVLFWWRIPHLAFPGLSDPAAAAAFCEGGRTEGCAKEDKEAFFQRLEKGGRANLYFLLESSTFFLRPESWSDPSCCWGNIFFF